MIVDTVLAALLGAGFDYEARADDEWVSDCPNCGLDAGLLIREHHRGANVELCCGVGCRRSRIESALSHWIPEEPREPFFSLSAGSELLSLHLITSSVYVARLTGREPEYGRVRCPRHAEGKERDPALRVNRHGSGWYCYVCAVGGGILEFYAFLHNINMPRGGREFALYVKEVRRAMETPRLQDPKQVQNLHPTARE